VGFLHGKGNVVNDDLEATFAERAMENHRRHTEALRDQVREYRDEQNRRWAALDASVPCSHTIPGTCDYCDYCGGR